MKIKFDTAALTELEARGLSAMLAAMYPGSAPATYARVGDMEYATGSITINRVVDVSERFDPAPDGYPVEAEQPAGAVLNAPNPADFAPERDTDGIPWDARIHASTKTTNKDGTWTRRRNTPDETFDKVMAELKAANTAMTMAAAAGLTAPVEIQSYVEMPANSTPQQVAEAFVGMTTAAEAFTPPASVVIPAHVPAPPVPVPPVPVAPTVDDKSAEAVEIMKAVNAKQVPADKLAELVGKAGLKGLAEVFTASIEARRIIAAELAAL